MFGRIFGWIFGRSKKPQPAPGRRRVVAAAPATPVPAANAGRRISTSSPGDTSHAADGVEVGEWGGVRFEKRVIETTTELSRVIFDKVVNEDARLAPHLFASIAIATLKATEKTCIVFVDKSRAKREELEAAVEQMGRRGFKLPETGLQGYFATSSLVLAMSQNDITHASLQFEREVSRDPSKNALMSAFTDIVSWAYANNADDIDFAVNREASKSQICFKIGGRYIRPERFLLPTDTVIAMLGIAWQKSGGGASAQFDMKVEQQALVKLDLPRSPAIPQGARVRLRWSGMAVDKGTVVTTRIQRLGESALIRSLDAAGYVPTQMDIIRRVIHSEGGMIVLSGVVGSGKSTSLVQMINMLPTDIKIQSFEDPVELDLKNAYQKTITRDLAKSGDDKDFLSATRALYRSALDVLYLGEIRDRETGLVARQVVESGHSVYTTTHARSGLGITDRFKSPAIAMPKDVLATPGILKLLVYQALLPTNCPHCAMSPGEYARNFTLNPAELEEHNRYFDRLERLYGIGRNAYRLRNPNGCIHCIKDELPELNGFSGRTVVSELIEPDERMLEYILQEDNIGRDRYWRSMATPRFDDDNLVGKTTMECAVFKAVRGVSENGTTFGCIDPREIEPRFMSFETVEFKRQQSRKLAERANTSVTSGSEQRPREARAAEVLKLPQMQVVSPAAQRDEQMQATSVEETV
ncbi:MAG: hypothetical protein EPN79_10865 [Burkholderiaceae bacterium]|nr:MAG: hypothetical protein EPN79_10865 [Burkholderiaceae bacterium]TBR76814.1 MAG: hypothetical protein EPN64_06210 [Burkholderiaceae bacterium]